MRSQALLALIVFHLLAIPASGRGGKSYTAWTMELSQMKIPDAPVAGRIHGKNFVPDHVELVGSYLRFEQTNGPYTDLSIEVPLNPLTDDRFRYFSRLYPDQDDFYDGKTIRIGPTTKRRASVGVGHAVQLQYVESRGWETYAMIVELEPLRAALSGRLYVCVQDPEQSFAAGTFTVGGPGVNQITRFFIHGSLAYRGSERKPSIHVGCLGRNQYGSLENVGVRSELSMDPYQEDGEPGFRQFSEGWCRCWAFESRWTLLEWGWSHGKGPGEQAPPVFHATHQHINRPAGQYLLYVTGPPSQPAGDIVRKGEGFYDWKWVELKDDDSHVTADLTVDPKKLGTLEVTVGGRIKEESSAYVTYLPLDSAGRIPLAGALQHEPGVMGARLQGGKAVIRHLREGKYQIASGTATAQAVIKAGATTGLKLIAE